jgi:hypothetical protein
MLRLRGEVRHQYFCLATKPGVTLTARASQSYPRPTALKTISREDENMSILKNLQKVNAAVVLDNVNGNPPTLGKQIGNAAVAAITGGIASPAWKDYMSIFADNAEQLERLTVQKQGEADYLPQLRAYIVSNAVCDATTTTATANRVSNTIDVGLGEAADGTVVKPFPIPGV